MLRSHKNHRPGNWILEKSLDGASFEPWQYHATSNMDCWEAYRVNPTAGRPTYQTDDQVICTSFFAAPGINQEAYFQTKKGRPGEHSNAESLRKFMRARYIRIKMQKLVAPSASRNRERVIHPVKAGQEGREVGDLLILHGNYGSYGDLRKLPRVW